MKVSIKDFAVKTLELGSSGLELEIREPNGTRLGDLYVTMSSLIWCEGKTTKPKGKKISWATFLKWADTQ